MHINWTGKDISINKIRDTIVTTSVGTSSNPSNRVLYLGLHHFNPPSIWQAYKAKASLGRAAICAPKGQSDADAGINKLGNNEL